MASAAASPHHSLAAASDALRSSRLTLRLRSDALKASAIANFNLGDLTAALRDIREALAVAQQAGDSLREARCLVNLGILEAADGRPLAAFDSYAKALSIVSRTYEVSAIACGNIALLAERVGEYALALRFASAARDMLPPGPARAAASLNCGCLLGRLARPDEARACLSEAIALTAHGGQRVVHLDATAALAWLDHRPGRPDAVATLERCIHEADTAGLQVSALRARLLLVDVHGRMGQHTAALRLGRDCLPLLSGSGELGMHRELVTCLARSLAGTFQWREAYEHLAGLMPTGAEAAETVALRERLYHFAGDPVQGLAALSPASTSYAAGYGAARNLSLARVDADILCLVVAGRTNPEIAVALSKSPHTVRNRLARIMRTLSVQTRTAAARRALELGVVQVAGGATRGEDAAA